MQNSPSASHASGVVCEEGWQYSSFKAAYCVLVLVVGTVILLSYVYILKV